MKRAAVLALAALLLVAAAVAIGGFLAARDSGTEETADPPSTSEPDWRRCHNDDLGYAIAYPATWNHVKCAYFDPDQLEVPENSDFYGASLEVQVAQDSFENVVRGLTDRRFGRVISRRDVSVKAWPAVLVEVEATGQGLYEPGYRVYAYVLDVPGRPPVIVQATRAPGTSWDGKKEVADRAVRSLRVDRASQQDLPKAVAEKRTAMLDAALAGDYDALAQLADPDEFTYTFGGPQPGGPAAYWREASKQGERDPAQVLAALLALQPTETDGLYVWPFAYDRPPASLTEAERRALSSVASADEIAGWVQAGSYLGWRAGITSDGRWTFFVAGD